MILLLILLTSISSVQPILNAPIVVPNHPFWMFTVQIHYEEVYICTGSAITEYFVLTAGHCMEDGINQPWDTKIVANPRHANLELRHADPKYIHDVEKISIHNKFNPQEMGGNHEYDISLIKVKRSLPYKIKLHRDWLELKINSMCYYAGWGSWNTHDLHEMRTWIHHIEDRKIFTVDAGGKSLSQKVTKTDCKISQEF